MTGRVTQASFRESYLREAQRLGVRGWALSRDETRVDAVFEGEEDAVQQMIEWTRTGPAHAYVTSVEVLEESPGGETGFVVH
ncbi:MAG TPA: acylphosphatase [Microlunatus sp.]|nr:acylphosphatase [Microlunatus sp.]